MTIRTKPGIFFHLFLLSTALGYCSASRNEMTCTSTSVYSRLDVARASPFSRDFYTRIDSAASCRKCRYLLIYIQSGWITRAVFRLIKKAAITVTVHVCTALHNYSVSWRNGSPVRRPAASCVYVF